jgi:hypothetical protein
MENHIREIRITQRRLEPVEAELGITVYPEQLTSTTQVHGRLMGPHCRYASTVEVAYPLRESSRQYEKEGTPHITSRVIIPEASFWDPESPFLYEGPVELWQKGQLRDQRQLRHGLRTMNLGPRGLRWNGRLLTIHGAVCHQVTENELLALRQAGCNALLAPVEATELWDLADRLGFLMLGRIADRTSYGRERKLREHPSCMGWVLHGQILQHPIVKDAGVLPVGSLHEQLLGIELNDCPTEPLPESVQFVVCPEDLLPELARIRLPKLVSKATEFVGDKGGQRPAAQPGVLGWVYG